jgi:hypothetical protein
MMVRYLIVAFCKNRTKHILIETKFFLIIKSRGIQSSHGSLKGFLNEKEEGIASASGVMRMTRAVCIDKAI